MLKNNGFPSLVAGAGTPEGQGRQDPGDGAGAEAEDDAAAAHQGRRDVPTIDRPPPITQPFFLPAQFFSVLLLSVVS